MVEMKQCAGCGAEVPPDVRFGLCPKCLLDLGHQPAPAAGGHAEQHGRRFGDYELGRPIGSGGMGVVYEAVQVSLRRTVALKMILATHSASPVARRRFAIEAEAAAKLDHPNIVPIYEVGEHDDQPFLSMKFIPGESLRNKIASGQFCLANRATRPPNSSGGSRAAAVAQLLAAAARAVHHAHQHGVLHRDLKPGNILVDPQGQPHVTDFGLAKMLDEAPDDGVQLTDSGMILGTAGYMSPEQASGKRLSVAADIYSLGAILYEMLTGQPPFQGKTPWETMRLVTEQEPKAPHTLHRPVPKDLEAICLKCLEKNPAARYKSAEALAEDLERWLHQKPIQARPVGVILRAGRWIKRNPLGAALIGSLGIGVAVSMVLLHLAHQRQKAIDQLHDTLVYGYIQDIERLWRSPEGHSVKITSEWLAVLVHKRSKQADPTARRLSFSMAINDDPIGRAIHYADLFALLEEKMEKQLGKPVRLDMVFQKPGHARITALAEGEVDLSRSDILGYLRAKEQSPGIQPVVRQIDDKQAVIFARQDAGITNLSQLVGKRMAFAHTNATISFEAMVQLARAGIAGTNLAAFETFEAAYGPGLESPEGSRGGDDAGAADRYAHHEVVKRVLAGEFDAGECSDRHFESNRHKRPGLVELHTFPVPPGIIIARAGMDPQEVEALRRALVSLKSEREKELLEKLHGYTIKGYLPITDSYFDPFRSALTHEVRLFEKPQSPKPASPTSAE